ncbi:MAG: B12-binding domain-containing radical SAM protein [Candidatus Anammoxibacter sp.]
MQSVTYGDNQIKTAQIALLEHPRPENLQRTEDVVNSPLSACLMTGYIASVLESNGINVEVVDANTSGLSIKDTIEKLTGSSFLLIGIRLVYLWEETDEIFDLVKQLRNAGIRSHINLYGHYPTFTYKNIFKRFPFIDSITIGEPEYTFLELSKRIIGTAKNVGMKTDISSIDGLAYRNMLNEPAPGKLIENLDLLPFPDRRNIEDDRSKGITTFILGSRGCYNNCGFCYLNPFYGNGSNWRGRSAENIFKEIKQLYDQNGCTDFYFADANFFEQGRAGQARAKNLANLIIEDGVQINFGLECRANDIDVNTISLLVKAGLKNLFMGIESGDQSTLNAYRKKTTVEINKNAIRDVKKCGIVPNVGFIMFGKDIEIKGIRNNFEFLQETGLLTDPYTTAHLFYHKQSLFQGTPDYINATSRNNGSGTFRCTDQYEALFDYSDKRVSAFVEITECFCKTALSIISNNEDHDDSHLFQINELLVEIFDKTLSSIEQDDFDLSVNSIAELKEEHAEMIKEKSGVS